MLASLYFYSKMEEDDAKIPGGDSSQEGDSVVVKIGLVGDAQVLFKMSWTSK